jgi:hypothetical protein
MAQDWSVHALVYFYSAGSDLPWAVLNWRLDLEFADMTQEDIIRMAREVGLWPAVTDNFPKELVALAALVEAEARADERERIIVANAPEIEKTNAHIKMLEDEIAVIRARGQA